MVDSLFKEGIDTIIAFTPAISPMSNDQNDSCTVYERQYLFWRNRSGEYIAETFHCVLNKREGEKKVIRIAQEYPGARHYRYLAKHFHRITTEKLHPALLQIKRNGHLVSRDYSKIQVTDDAVASLTIFLKHARPLENWYAENDLNNGETRNLDGSLREKWKSRYYSTNLQKPLYQYTRMLQQSIAALHSSSQ